MIRRKEQWAEGKKAGVWEYLTVKGVVHRREHFEDDELHGLFEEIDVNSNARIVSGPYEQGRKHGKWERYFANGEPKDVVHFEHDLRYGDFQAFYENGQKQAVGAFKSDKKMVSGRNFIVTVISRANLTTPVINCRAQPATFTATARSSPLGRTCGIAKRDFGRRIGQTESCAAKAITCAGTRPGNGPSTTSSAS